MDSVSLEEFYRLPASVCIAEFPIEKFRLIHNVFVVHINDGSFETGSIVLARRTFTLVDVVLAPLPVVTFPAQAPKAFDLVNALGTVLAWIWHAIVDIGLAMIALETCIRAIAQVTVHVVDALAVIEARASGTIVDVGLAVLALIAGCAGAGVASYLIVTSGTVLTG